MWKMEWLKKRIFEFNSIFISILAGALASSSIGRIMDILTGGTNTKFAEDLLATILIGISSILLAQIAWYIYTAENVRKGMVEDAIRRAKELTSGTNIKKFLENFSVEEIHQAARADYVSKALFRFWAILILIISGFVFLILSRP